VGTLGAHQGAVIDRTFGEPLGGVEIELTDAGLADPVLRGMPARFTAFTGHKEACTRLPPHAVLLASSQACPVQMFRIKENLYATQFHPELDVRGLVTRIDIYRHAGYFPPESAEDLMVAAQHFTVTEPMTILKNFVARYAS
jgi:GMP synthase (glutamine-hydrolysing)